MKKKPHRHPPKRNKPARPRNAATGLAPAAPRARARITRSAPPDWKTIAAAVAGGAGSAALGGLVVNQQILLPEAVGIGLMLGGGATAYFSDGTPRIVGTSIAAAGAGQFALALMNKRALKAHGDANPTPASTPQAQLPAPPRCAAAEREHGRHGRRHVPRRRERSRHGRRRVALRRARRRRAGQQRTDRHRPGRSRVKRRTDRSLGSRERPWPPPTKGLLWTTM